FYFSKPRPFPSRRKSSIQNEKSIEILEDEDFARLVGEFKYKSPLLLSDTANIPCASRPPSVGNIRETSLEGFFRETKTTSKPKTSRVKTTLRTRVSVPSKPIPTRKKPALTPVVTPQTSFFTTWAAAQAPTTRPAKA